MAVDNVERAVGEVVFPGDIVDVDFHDADIGDGRAEVQGMHRGEVRVVVVGRAVELVALGEQGDIAGAGEALPGDVDHHVVHGARFEVGAVVADGVEVFAGGDGDAGLASDVGERLGLVHVDLDPHHLELFERLADLAGDERRAVEVEVERDLHIGPGAGLERADVFGNVAQQRGDGVAVEVVDAAPAGSVDAGRVAGEDDVGLEGVEALLADFDAEGGDVVHRAQRRRADQLVAAGAGGAAVGPVDHLALAGGAAEEGVDGHAEGFALDVPEGELDAGDGFGGDAAGRLAGEAVHVPVAGLDGERVAAEQDRLHVLDGSDDAVGVASVGHFAVAGDALVGADGDELPGPPAGVDDEGFDFADLHGRSSFGVRRSSHGIKTG